MSRPGCKRVGSFFLLRVYWGSGWMINEKTAQSETLGDCVKILIFAS